jgi:hypothetical protein
VHSMPATDYSDYVSPYLNSARVGRRPKTVQTPRTGAHEGAAPSRAFHSRQGWDKSTAVHQSQELPGRRERSTAKSSGMALFPGETGEPQDAVQWRSLLALLAKQVYRSKFILGDVIEVCFLFLHSFY